MSHYRTSFWLNGLFLLMLIGLVAYVKSAGLSAKALFLHPETYPHFTVASLTHLFQMLSGVPPIICWFTYGLLRSVRSEGSRAETRFILASALVTSGFWLNEIYRIHIYLSIVGIGKPVVILIYAITLAIYALSFRKQLLSTPYPILLTGVGILFVGIFIDALQLPDQNLTDFLEGIPKVLSQLNVAYYFWCVCRQAMRPFPKTAPSILTG
ncbi:MAG: hypothetical protein HC827_07740 [Cyanobacteria bacterium RM1_2_2]|nr:hypothetical protein [Cyanobacteria bacterium RM1_2_2]